MAEDPHGYTLPELRRAVQRLERDYLPRDVAQKEFEIVRLELQAILQSLSAMRREKEHEISERAKDRRITRSAVISAIAMGVVSTALWVLNILVGKSG